MFKLNSKWKIKFLIDETQAKSKLMGTKMGQAMSPDKELNYFFKTIYFNNYSFKRSRNVKSCRRK